MWHNSPLRDTARQQMLLATCCQAQPPIYMHIVYGAHGQAARKVLQIIWQQRVHCIGHASTEGAALAGGGVYFSDLGAPSECKLLHQRAQRNVQENEIVSAGETWPQMKQLPLQAAT